MAYWKNNSPTAQFRLDPLAGDNAEFGTDLNILFDDMAPLVTNSNQSSETSHHNWILDSATGEVVDSRLDLTKRARLEDDDMDKNACWTSPLCPNSKADGSHPELCKGECAEFLFANPESMPDEKRMLLDMMERSKPKIPVSPSNITLSLKRSDVSPDDETQSPPRSKSAERTSSPTHEVVDRLVPTAMASVAISKPARRVPHNQVEKKYRENVNSQLEALRQAIPLKQHLASFTFSPSSLGLSLDIEDLAAAASAPRQISKAVVLSSATAYIKMLERENQKLKDDLEALKFQNKTLQGLVKADCSDCSLMNYMKRWKLQGPVV